MHVTSQTLIGYLTHDLGIEDPIDERTALFSSSILDSFQMMSLVEFIERRCGFRIAPDDVTLENMDTIERILGYAQRRIAS